MELFSEVYGCYYAVVSEILRSAPLTRAQAEAQVKGSSGRRNTAPIDRRSWAISRSKFIMIQPFLELGIRS